MRAVTRDGVDITRLVYLHRMNHLSILLQELYDLPCSLPRVIPLSRLFNNLTICLR